MEMNGNNLAKSKKERLVYLDNLKVALILLVIAHHAGQAYGYQNDWPILNSQRSIILEPFFDVNGAFFMGFFFFISAYFFPASMDGRGVFSFLKSRFFRLGIPFIFIVIVVFGPITYFVDSIDMPFGKYMLLEYIGKGDFEVGHLWFIALLLFFAFCYSIIRLINLKLRMNSQKTLVNPPGNKSLLMLSIILIILNYVIRIWFPIGRWIDIFSFMPVEMGRLPQYIIFFILGIFAYRHNWINIIPTKTGVTWFIIGIIAALIHYINLLIGLFTFDIWPILEGFIGVGLIVGLLVISREYWNKRGKFMKFMSDNAFTVYLIHIFIIYILQFIIEDMLFGPLDKFFIVFFIGSLLSFILSYCIRKIPFLKKFL
ncbi:acyltransferase family protein [Clostridium sp. BJN0013]|uniref:acyltransferase family protein n=1 Tax=Clostridium sp. BJN0013 TaxID=3236840 RepID=UPI0034C602A1